MRTLITTIAFVSLLLVGCSHGETTASADGQSGLIGAAEPAAPLASTEAVQTESVDGQGPGVYSDPWQASPPPPPMLKKSKGTRSKRHKKHLARKRKGKSKKKGIARRSRE